MEWERKTHEVWLHSWLMTHLRRLKTDLELGVHSQLAFNNMRGEGEGETILTHLDRLRKVGVMSKALRM